MDSSYLNNEFKLSGMFSYIHDMDIVIECLVPIMIDVSAMTKIMNSILNMNEVCNPFFCDVPRLSRMQLTSFVLT